MVMVIMVMVIMVMVIMVMVNNNFNTSTYNILGAMHYNNLPYTPTFSYESTVHDVMVYVMLCVMSTYTSDVTYNTIYNIQCDNICIYNKWS